MSHHTIGKLVQRKRSMDGSIGIVLKERLKETFDENGYGGCFVPQVLVAWQDLGQQQWLARKLLAWGRETESGEIKFS